MARTDTLPHFLTDVADAIRTKTGSSETIQASTFDTAISNIPSGSPTPTSIAELESSLGDVCEKYEDYLLSLSNNYASIVSSNITLYTPNADYPIYVIRKRDNYYQILWFPKMIIKDGSGSFSMRRVITTQNPQHPGFVEKPSNYAYIGWSLNSYMTANNIPTLEEAIAMIQSSNTTYSLSSTFDNWGYQTYSQDYFIPCTNAPMQDANDTFINMQRISSNETIQVIE